MLENLKKLRWQRGISQQKLADAILVSQQSVNKYENHDVEPDIEVLIRIADYFDTSIDYLVGRVEEQEIQTQQAVDITANEKRLLETFRTLSKRQKESILFFLDVLKEKE